jgi:hypothetical protein
MIDSPIWLTEPPTWRSVTLPSMATIDPSGLRKSCSTTSQLRPNVRAMPGSSGFRNPM